MPEIYGHELVEEYAGYSLAKSPDNGCFYVVLPNQSPDHWPRFPHLDLAKWCVDSMNARAEVEKRLANEV